MQVDSSKSLIGTTDKGTKIVKSNNEMDKNAFLRILVAELSNQDPENAKDSSQYVAQMAQFASLEQMSNLNNTSAMNSANSLIGKMVGLNLADPQGVPYAGIVKGVTKSGSNITLNVQVNSNGQSKIIQVDYSDITDVVEVPDYSNDVLNENVLLLTASSLIGKKAEFNDKDKDGNSYKGKIEGVFIDGNTIKFKVSLDSTGEKIDLPYTSLKSVNQ